MISDASEQFIEPVRSFADTFLEHGRDPFDETPLFVDAMNPDTDSPVAHDVSGFLDSIGKSDRICCSLASQQEFFRVLVGLDRLTGTDSYRAAAESAIQHAFETMTDSNGLLYWGVSCTYDLETKQPLDRNDRRPAHCLKWYYPYYELMWETDPDATKRFVESFWSAHIYDWSTLDFDRWALYDKQRNDVWDQEYAGGEPFFWGDGLTFVNTGSDLYFAAANLAAFSDEQAPLEWAQRLAHRYVETRHPNVGISGYQFSQSRNQGPYQDTDDPRRERFRIRSDRAQHNMAPYLPDDRVVYEGTIFRPKPCVQRAQLQLSERLDDDGEAFEQWALEELRAWREEAYRPDDNTFEPMLTDGYSLEGFVHQRDGYFGDEGDEIGPIEADPSFFWLYSYAYRVSESRDFWQMSADIASGLGLGNLGTPDGATVAPTPRRAEPDYRLLLGLLELHRATGEPAFLEAAIDQGELLLNEYFVDGYFVSEGRSDVSLIGSHVPLALLHLAAAIEGDETPIPNSGGRTSNNNNSFI